jgi:hypothetical protein
VIAVELMNWLGNLEKLGKYGKIFEEIYMVSFIKYFGGILFIIPVCSTN